MGRFNVTTWSARSDSSPGADYAGAGLNPETDVVLVVAPDNNGRRGCLCGCAEYPTGKGAQFRMGHDATYRGKLIRAHLTGTPVTRQQGDHYLTLSARSWAEGLDWTPYLDAAEAKQGAQVRAKLEGSNSRVLAAAIGPQVGERRLVKVGRWNYTGQILAIYEDRGTYQIEYVTKKGELVRTEVPADKVGSLAVEEA